ncbi:hypothetical protein AZE42_04140 [Rhizopogon vesiculosus]|uniref:Thiamine-binding protein domain-containing protein n=1 Tax=Rhizopogon vesiculosus TaxID=180088 RepID=A0A1J8QVA8_9AGAM|nr:hypothetical protein AZE42_04140 [Rhizopogon vesiculosus]
MSSTDLYVVAGSKFPFLPHPDGNRGIFCRRAYRRVSQSLGKIRFDVQGDGYGTNIEGPWSEVSQAIHDCHVAVHAKGAPRIATNVRIGTRTDRETPVGHGNEVKMKRVEEILARDK